MVNQKAVECKRPLMLNNMENYSFCNYLCLICLSRNVAVTAPSCQPQCASIFLVNYSSLYLKKNENQGLIQCIMITDTAEEDTLCP